MLIKNGSVMIDGELQKVNILIKDGKIAKLTTEEPESHDIIDVNGLTVIPGCIDVHEHCRDLNQAYKEDFLTASMAAAKGGITTICAMPNTDPPVIDKESLEKEREVAKESVVNYGLYVAGVDGNSAKIPECNNIAGVKVFMDVTTGNLKVSDDAELERLFSSYKRIAVHAEEDHVHKAISLIKKTGNSLYLVHISRADEIETIRKERNKQVFCEVTPHHLYFTSEDVEKLKGYGIMKPPLQSKKDQVALWEALADGTVDTVGTDHAPHTKEEKEGAEPVYGVTGSETMLPLLLHAVYNKLLSLARVVELTSINPARIFGMKNKGKIAQGYDADLVLIDMNADFEVKNEELLTKCGWSPFHGYVLKGMPVMTIVNGNVVYDGKIHKEFKGSEVIFE